MEEHRERSHVFLAGMQSSPAEASQVVQDRLQEVLDHYADADRKAASMRRSKETAPGSRKAKDPSRNTSGATTSGREQNSRDSCKLPLESETL